MTTHDSSSTSKAPETVTGGDFSRQELLHYARHLAIPEFGLAGQQQLKRGSVLVIGAGGLGSPALLYLAAAGVGRIGIMDADRVEPSNLQRQVLFGTADVGSRKVDAAAARLRGINPHVEIQTFPVRFTPENAAELVADFDVVLDGTDNFPTRYLSNDVCVLQGKPNIYGTVLRFAGQVSVFQPSRGGPCYRCMMPEPPPAGVVPNCAEGGVLGVMPGIIGGLQALEALKLLGNLGDPLRGRLLVVEGLAMSFRQLTLRRDPSCPVCGENPSIKSLSDFDYEALARLCEVPAPVKSPVEQISARELQRMLDDGPKFVLLDVREPAEFAIARIPGARNVPLGELESALSKLDPAAPMVVHCKSGGRSARAAALLQQRGFTALKDFSGGIDEWSEIVDPALPRY